MTSKALTNGIILLVDDEEAVASGLGMILESEGMDNVKIICDSTQVLSEVRNNYVKVVLLDLCMPKIDGRQLLGQLVSLYPQIPIIVVTGYNDVEIAIECVKTGAFDYLVKPVDDTRFVSSVKRAIEFADLRKEYDSFKRRVLENQLEQSECFSNFITNSNKIYNLFQYAETIATTNRPVLITGETGTGKELMARSIHQVSGKTGPFVALNIAGLDDYMFSDTLFGHQQGAFTGAISRRAGLIEKAKGGTLFLDEIGDLKPESQVRLLRLLQENEYFPLGSDAPKWADTRVLVATNVKLDEATKEGKFRSDLYFRLRTHHVDILPLRDRKEDIPILLNHFLEKAAFSLERKVATAPAELFVLLSTYSYPGNVRELEAMVFDAVSKHKGGILSMSSFEEYIMQNSKEGEYSQSEEGRVSLYSGFQVLPTLTQSRDMLIKEALERTKGNQTIAAKMLGITRSGLSKALSRKPD